MKPMRSVFPAAQDDPPAGSDELAAMADVLCAARREGEGDLDKILVLLAVAVRSAPAQADPRGRGGAYAQSMAAALGMPRETVRRKVAAMVGAGWLERRDGRLLLTAAGADRLTALVPLVQPRAQ
jgi:hypothetical protein